MLSHVLRPDGFQVSFTYDALGRRLTKSFRGDTTKWVWDGNTPLHEWVEETNLKQQSEEAAANAAITGGSEALDKIKVSMTTWLFEPESFAPLAKQVNGKTFGIITDHLGTPLSMHDVEGRTIWSAELNCYGQIENLVGKAKDCPFRYPGQYEDVETGLYYNRFRYYSPEEGMYISQDPIGLEGGNPTLYGYVHDINAALDPLGLQIFYHATKSSNAAESISTEGINLTKGRHSLDFNPAEKGGFYTTTNLSQAQQLAGPKGKVMIYDVPDSELVKLKGKNFNGPDAEWGDFVKKGRSGVLMHNYDIVSGEMISYKNFEKGIIKSIGGQQTALFTEKAAKLFDKYYIGEHCNKK